MSCEMGIYYLSRICIGDKFQNFLHLNHVVVAVELAAAFMEGANFGKA